MEGNCEFATKFLTLTYFKKELRKPTWRNNPVSDDSLLTTVDSSAVECHERRVKDEPRPDACWEF